MIITSVDNDKIKNLSKLNQKKYRDLSNNFIVEGEHLILEAYKSNCLIEVFILDGFDIDIDVNKTFVSSEVMKKITALDSIPNMIGLCNKIDNKDIIGDKILILDEIQDPGNLGTIIRSAIAFNIDTIIMSENCVDLYNPKVIRATQGMIFHINIISMDIDKAIDELKSKNIIVYGTDVNGGVDVRTLNSDEKKRYALVMGNEGNGVRESIKNKCDKNLYILLNDNVESLNVAIATSILLYELGR